MPPVLGDKKGKSSSTSSKDRFNIIDETSKKEDNLNERTKRGKKRSFETPTPALDMYDSMDEDEQDVNEETKASGDMEMQNLLASFGADIRKNIATKKKNVQQFTTGALKTTDKKVGEIWKKQKTDRNKLLEEYSKSVKNVIIQWESDVQKMKDAEEKYENLFQQMHKTIQQQRVVQTQRMKTVVQLTDQLKKSFDELENCHLEQQGNVQGELKKEMAQLQKKILKETQQQELCNVRKSLQTMLAQV